MPLNWNIAESILKARAESSDLKKVQNFRSVNKKGVTLLHFAVSYISDVDAISFLVEKGAYINAKDNDGNTPLQRAVYSREIHVVEYLVDKGIDEVSFENRSIIRYKSKIIIHELS